MRLERVAYDRLRDAVLERDGWRCQDCGRRSNLEVPHLRHRSQQGEDTAESLIALCAACHGQRHRENEDLRA